MADSIVIGANGFLGSSLVDELATRGHTVTAFDRFSRPTTYSAKVRSVTGDFLDSAALASAIRGHEHVFHFQSTTTPASADGDPVRDVRENLLPTIHLLDACVQAGVGTVHFASTGGAIYGDQGMEVMSEHSRTRPVSPYAIGKLAIEGYLAYFSRRHGLNSVTYRISNPYGPRQLANRGQGVLPTFLRQVRRGERVQVFGDGTSVRDYIHVDDAVSMIAKTVDRPTEHAIYNIGSGESTSLFQLLKIIADVTQTTPVVEYLAEPSTFVHRSVLDTSRYVREFGKHDLRTLEEGVTEMWEHIA